LSAQTYQSRVTRPPEQEAQLRAAGERLLILQLQGFIFFGTANQLLNRLRARVNDADLPPLETVIIDLERVTGMDSTAEISFRNMVRLAQRQQFRILFAGAEEKVRWQLAQAGQELAESERVLYAPSLDRGMSFWEEDLLTSTAVADNAAPAPWAMALPPGMSMDRLLGYFEKLEMEAGTHVMRAGAAGDALYLLAEGQVTAQIERPDRPPLRLQTVHNGRLIGELGFYLEQPRSVDVVADTPVTLYRLDRARLAQMEREDPASASALHRLLIMHLGERVSNLSRTVNALER